MLGLVAEHGVERVVFSSSSAVYGHAAVCPVDQRAPTRPSCLHGEVNLVCERMLDWYGRLHGVRFANLRCFEVAGAAMDGSLDEFTRPSEVQLLPALTRAAVGQGHAVRATGFPTRDGTAVRDFVHVVDAARAHVQVLEGLTSPELNGAYNIGRGEGRPCWS